MMRRVLLCSTLVLAGLTLATARGEDKASSDTDTTFAQKAAAGGLAEVNMGNIAVKYASDPAVKKFATRMVADHEKANRELITLANKKRITLATSMDADHRAMADKLSKLSGAAFDREYMTGQV